MIQNYFVINGEKYYTGTIFIVKEMEQQVEAAFVCYDQGRKKYVYKIKDHTWHVDEQTFRNRFVDLTNRVDQTTTEPTMKTKSDMRIGGLFFGWIWYIFLMAISAIFKDAIALWILISVVFFSWRTAKIKKEGTYIEW